MSISSTSNHLWEASRNLGYAISDGGSADFSAAGIRNHGERSYPSIDESLGPIAIHIQESNLALDAATAAMQEVEGIRPLDSLKLQEMRDAKERAVAAEQKFGTATDLVKTVIENTKKVPELLRSTPGELSNYIKNGKSVLEFAQREEGHIGDAKGLVDQVLTADHQISQKTTQLLEKTSDISQMTIEANGRLSGDTEEANADSDPRLLQTLVDNIQASLALLESSLDKPLNQFTAILRDATNKVTEADLGYLKDLNDRLKQSMDTHAAASDLREEVRLSVFDIQDDIKAFGRSV